LYQIIPSGDDAIHIKLPDVLHNRLQGGQIVVNVGEHR
jgi:hypothetical protein